MGRSSVFSPYTLACATPIANNFRSRILWLGTAFFLLIGYSSTILLLAIFNTSELVQEKLFVKVIAWESLIKKFHHIAQQIETKTQRTPIFISSR